MIDINVTNKTYTCPFCGHIQAFDNSYTYDNNGEFRNTRPIPTEYRESSFTIYSIRCCNSECRKISVIAINRTSNKQVDIVPQKVIRTFPEYIPEQIKMDYEEASQIIDISPRASSTLLRRCLQGMIHDFWGIHEKNLNAEITVLKGKVTEPQWKAIDGLRKIGNIGAHMESDVDMIIPINPDEAKALKKLIELLLDKWYISRHDEEALFNNIAEITDQKEQKRKQ